LFEGLDATNRASSGVKKVMPGPGSSTVIPALTRGERIALGSCGSRLRGLAGSEPCWIARDQRRLAGCEQKLLPGIVCGRGELRSERCAEAASARPSADSLGG